MIQQEGVVKIIVIDDSDFLRKEMVEILEEEGLNVVGEAKDPKEAMEVLSNTRANIIIIDVVMPEVNGIELARVIKENFSNIYIIMVSALGDDHIVLDAISTGAIDFLKKPFRKEDLVGSVKKIADQIMEESSS